MISAYNILIYNQKSPRLADLFFGNMCIIYY